MKLGIGIDTGGTYTDVVVYDFESCSVLGTSKAQTTRDDLSAGILEALDALPPELYKEARVISLSTTLATNACVEDRGGNAKLIFFGGDRSIIDKYGWEYGLPTSKGIYIQENYTDFSGEAEREPDWDLFCSKISDTDEGFSGMDGVGIVEINATKNNARNEKKARDLFRQIYDIPVVCGHELFNVLNCLQRGSSTLLNARLFPVIQEFITAIRKAIRERGIDATVVILRSDGSLMSDELAKIRPVDTLLCGPAASVMGSSNLADEQNCVVVDMGGTTTDIALIKDGIPVKVTGGISIGRWKTFVDGLSIKTFGLGGDTAVHYNEYKMVLEDYRVVPLCVAADKYPVIERNLKALCESGKKHTKFYHEHFLPVRDIADSDRYTEDEKAFCAALKEQPMSLAQAVASIPGKDVYTFNVSRLVKEGVIQVSGLTPTDIMHIKGDFNKFNTEASLLGARYVAANLKIPVDELCDRVYDEIKRRLYVNIVKFLLENKDPYYKNGVSKEVERIINENYDKAGTASTADTAGTAGTASTADTAGTADTESTADTADTAGPGSSCDLISMTFSTDFTLAGVGAPIHLFLHDVAAKLGTAAVLPKHYEVANALGAIVGKVIASNTVEIKPDNMSGEGGGYTVYGNTETRSFKELEDAEEFAIREATNSAYQEAVRRGAAGEIATTYKLEKREVEVKTGILHLWTRATAHAVGAVG